MVLKQGRMVVGRERPADVSLGLGTLSKRHAEFEVRRCKLDPI